MEAREESWPLFSLLERISNVCWLADPDSCRETGQVQNQTEHCHTLDPPPIIPGLWPVFPTVFQVISQTRRKTNQYRANLSYVFLPSPSRVANLTNQKTSVGALNIPEIVFGAATLSELYNPLVWLSSDAPYRTVRLALRSGKRPVTC